MTATNVWHWTTYPNLAYEIVYPQDISMAPWLKFPSSPVCKGGGRPGPVENPKIGWMTAALAIDPFDSNGMGRAQLCSAAPTPTIGVAARSRIFQ